MRQQPLALAESGGSKRKVAPNEGPRPAGMRLDALRARGAEPLRLREGSNPNGRDRPAGSVHESPVRRKMDAPKPIQLTAYNLAQKMRALTVSICEIEE